LVARAREELKNAAVIATSIDETRASSNNCLKNVQIYKTIMEKAQSEQMLRTEIEADNLKVIENIKKKHKTYIESLQEAHKEETKQLNEQIASLIEEKFALNQEVLKKEDEIISLKSASGKLLNCKNKLL